MGSKSEVLLVTDVPNLPSSIIMWATRTYGDRVRESTALTVLTDILQIGGKLDFETSSVDVVISLVETPGFHNWAWLLEVARVLKTSGDFRIQEPLVRRKLTNEERRRLTSTPAQDKGNLERSLLLAGFVNVEMEEPMDGVGLSSEYKFITPTHVASINGPLLKPFAMKAKKPTWDSRSTFAIKKKVTYSHQGSRLDEHWMVQAEKDRHMEATAQTDAKSYRDVNVSTQIVHDRNDRYLDPYHRTYDQQIEAMVQTDYNVFKDMLTGGDTPLPTSQGPPKVTPPSQFHHMPEELQSLPNKRTFKLDLSSVRTYEDSFELVDDDEVLTEEDNLSFYHESNSCHASKTPCRYCLGGPYELDKKQQQTDQFSPWRSERVRLWLAKYLYKLCRVLAIKIYRSCYIEGKHYYKEVKMFTSLCIARLYQLIIHLVPYARSFIANSSSWPIVGLFLPKQMHMSIQVDKATQACSRSRRPSSLSLHKHVDTDFTF